MILKLVRTPGIYLVGFMGSGKTTVGRLLADRLGWRFVDLDGEIEAEQKTTIAQIFEDQGEERFRELEAEAIRKWVHVVRSGRPVVLALGGGAFARPDNAEYLGSNGVTVWLDCPLERLRRRVAVNSDRPLARDSQRFEELYHLRAASYACADFRLEAGGDSPEAVVDALCRLPIF
jgi:shikimate kinase